jgi:hypothetical protein
VGVIFLPRREEPQGKERTTLILSVEDIVINGSLEDGLMR